VLIVGGGPAGAAAAIYAARKGIRTGVVAERFGGQVLDTLGIENFISVKDTEGPKLAAALEAARARLRRRHHEPAARATSWCRRRNARRPDRAELASGATLKSRAVISPPARAGAKSTCRASASTATTAWPTARTATARCSRASAWP
jgi:alkyl hydroperoxide reductase subunit F